MRVPRKNIDHRAAHAELAAALHLRLARVAGLLQLREKLLAIEMRILHQLQPLARAAPPAGAAAAPPRAPSPAPRPRSRWPSWSSAASRSAEASGSGSVSAVGASTCGKKRCGAPQASRSLASSSCAFTPRRQREKSLLRRRAAPAPPAQTPAPRPADAPARAARRSRRAACSAARIHPALKGLLEAGTHGGQGGLSICLMRRRSKSLREACPHPPRLR